MNTFTLAEIEAQRTPAGGFTREGLAALGIDWPPPRGWHKRLMRAAGLAEAAARASESKLCTMCLGFRVVLDGPPDAQYAVCCRGCDGTGRIPTTSPCRNDA